MCSKCEFTGQTLSDNMTSDTQIRKVNEQQKFKIKAQAQCHREMHHKRRYGVKHYNGAHQYGVPMKVSLLCRVLVFFADTPKSAGKKRKKK